MEITTTIGFILDRKGGRVWSVSPEDTVFNAISLMAEKNIGALPVMLNGHLEGMISERDYARKVVLLGRVSRTTPVSSVMVRHVITVSRDDTVQECLEIMTAKRFRHLPVVEDGALIGLISIGDLVNWIINAQAVAIDDLEHFVTGAYPA